MRAPLICLSVLLFCAVFTKAQTAGNGGFVQFASRQDSLFVNAYEKRDTKTYNALLQSFLTKYNKLPKDDQRRFSRYYTSAYYNLACTYSLLNNKPQALESLERAIKGGYYNYAHILEDSDLNAIRNEAQFKTLINPLRETGDYLYILKKAGNYNLNDNRSLPAFTYQEATDANLASLRKAFNLDSVAGTGNEVSRILNLLHWIHNLVPHDGNHNNPEVKNAMSMIAECKRDNRGLNCRGLATVLNECYLSLGIKSRFVTCLPKDSLQVDNDCHVINMVYAPTLQKWLWIDPTNDAYVMNEKGELLSVEEVRDRIINNKPMIVNPDANWNHKASTLKEEYLYSYMAKNLYILECPVRSEYDAETKTPGKTVAYIQLLPLDYFKQAPDKTEQKNAAANITMITYNTNNPAQFWKAI